MRELESIGAAEVHRAAVQAGWDLGGADVLVFPRASVVEISPVMPGSSGLRQMWVYGLGSTIYVAASARMLTGQLACAVRGWQLSWFAKRCPCCDVAAGLIDAADAHRVGAYAQLASVHLVRAPGEGLFHHRLAWCVDHDPECPASAVALARLGDDFAAIAESN